jgi:hypothetical protein
VQARKLGELCLGAQAAGPDAFANAFIDGGRRWAIGRDGAAAVDVGTHPDAPTPIVSIPVKLSVLAAAQLAAIGTLVTSASSRQMGIAALGRSVVEGCSAVAWLLDDTATPDVRRRRAWLLWAVAEGKAALTAAEDAGRTGAMSGSPDRLVEIEAAIHKALAVRLDRGDRSKPKDWRLDGVTLPGQRTLVVSAVNRWFPRADGGILYSQVSRKAHSDVLIALALVDDTLAIRSGEGLDFVPTILAFWAMTWNHVLSYLGLTSEPFDKWRDEMLIVIGRSDLAAQ